MYTYIAPAQQKKYIYDAAIPNSSSEGSEKYMANLPEIYYYEPKGHVNNQAILIIPGGGYAHIAIKHEGHDVAQLLAEAGYAAFVLKYRLPSDEIMQNKSIGPLQDAQRAMQLIRTWPGSYYTKVGIMGFSAGGHVASSLATHYQESLIDNPNQINLNPDFTVLCYPVITMDPEFTHMGSRKNLLGENPSLFLEQEFSNEQHVNASTSPTFLMHAQDDQVVKIVNTNQYKAALDKFRIPNELFVFEEGGHGFGLINKKSSDSWMEACLKWMSKLK